MGNILLAQEVVRDYHVNRDKLRCAIKVDIKKAFDSVSWDFILTIMTFLNLHPKFIQLGYKVSDYTNVLCKD